MLNFLSSHCITGNVTGLGLKGRGNASHSPVQNSSPLLPSKNVNLSFYLWRCMGLEFDTSP